VPLRKDTLSLAGCAHRPKTTDFGTIENRSRLAEKSSTWVRAFSEVCCTLPRSAVTSTRIGDLKLKMTLVVIIPVIDTYLASLIFGPFTLCQSRHANHVPSLT
jgi:hypothetical protein